MTGNTDSGQRQTGLLESHRARVPFAIVAVLLLVSAVALVGFLETRGSAETDTDPSLAMDRTDAAIQTALRDATASAAQQAGEEPLTSPANTSYGEALDTDRPFMSYMEALVYTETKERFRNTGQRVGDVETTVSLPPITGAGSFEDAIDRVSLSESNGLLTVELDGVEITAGRDGERLASRTESVEVSVPTPVVRQHERTQQFQQQLDAGVTSPGSFSQRFNARTYVLGWLRGYAQYGGAPVTEVIANRHIKPAANSALYRTQKDVFGAADPSLDDAVRRGWFCMAAKDAEALYGGFGPGGINVADDICRASEWIFGDKHTSALPDPPDVLDMFGEAPGMNQQQTIGVNETAYSPLRTLVAGSSEHSIERAIERAFTVETDIDADIDALSTPAFNHKQPHSNATVTDSQRSNNGVTVSSGVPTPGAPQTTGVYYRFSDVDAAVEITETRSWEWTENGSNKTATTSATDTLDLSLTVELAENRTAPDMHIDEFNGDLDVEYKYRYGPASPGDGQTVPAPGFQNYADRETDVAEAVIGGTNLTAFAWWLEDQWKNATSKHDIGLPETRDAVIDLDASQETQLVSTALDDISELQQVVEGINHTFERADIVRSPNGTGPVGELAAAVETAREGYLDRDDDYENVGQLAVYEVRYAYFETLLDDLLQIESAHGTVMGELDSHLGEVDSSLDDALSFLQQGVGATGPADDPDAPPLASPPITPEITYEVSGSPTYLAGKPVTTDEVPAVEQDETFSPFAAKNTNFLKLPYKTIVNGIIDKVFNMLGIGGSDTKLTLRTAGEALRAGELAETAARADGKYANSSNLSTLNDDVRDALSEGLDEFSKEMGIEVVREVYGADPLPAPPYYENATHLTATSETQNATAAIIKQFNSTAEAAIAIGGGNATEPLVTAISEALTGVERPPYAETLSSNGWQEVVASGVRPALDRAAGNATATFSTTTTVENLDTATRQALENVSKDILKNRLESYIKNRTFDLSTYENWVGNGSEIDTPVRVPAGLPLLPFPTMWMATMNVWDIDADGEYARFEVEANMSAPGRATSTTYVRENTTIERTIAGQERTLGSVEPIEFDGRSLLVVVVPPGGIGVGDRDDENPECTETYPIVGHFDSDDTSCKFVGSG